MFTKDELINLMALDTKIPTNKWDLYVRLVNDKWLLPIIGTTIWDDLKLKKALTTLTPSEQEMVDWIGFATGWLLESEYIADDVQIAAAGTAKRAYGGDEWVPMSNNQSGNFRDYKEATGKIYLEKIRLWVDDLLNQTNTKPIQRCSMFFTNKRKGC